MISSTFVDIVTLLIEHPFVLGDPADFVPKVMGLSVAKQSYVRETETVTQI